MEHNEPEKKSWLTNNRSDKGLRHLVRHVLWQPFASIRVSAVSAVGRSDHETHCMVSVVHKLACIFSSISPGSSRGHGGFLSSAETESGNAFRLAYHVPCSLVGGALQKLIHVIYLGLERAL